MTRWRLSLKFTDEEITRRRSLWKPLPPKVTEGYLARYARQVSSAATGVGFH